MKIGILGTGTWGTALGRMLFNSGHDVVMWSAIASEIDALEKDRKHVNLPGTDIPSGIVFTKNIEKAIGCAELLLFAVPSVFVRQTAKKAAPFITEGQILVDVAKGIEPDTLMTMSEIIKDELGDKKCEVVALSGPTHAEEVAKDLPTTIVSACKDMATAQAVQDVFMNTCMRVYTNPDVKGVELCGALKNIMALASGIAAGLGYGDNAKAAIITRGLAEMERLGIKMGCRHETFAGLAGMGDIIVTATSVHSRNNRCGFLIGQGLSPQEAVKKVGMVVEGINAIPAATELAKRYGVEMPIVQSVDQVVNHEKDPSEAVTELMMRSKKAENQAFFESREEK